MSREVSVRLTPIFDLNHWRSESISEIKAIGVSQICDASKVMRSKSPSGGVSRIFRLCRCARRSGSLPGIGTLKPRGSVQETGTFVRRELPDVRCLRCAIIPQGLRPPIPPEQQGRRFKRRPREKPSSFANLDATSLRPNVYPYANGSLDHQSAGSVASRTGGRATFLASGNRWRTSSAVFARAARGPHHSFAAKARGPA